MSSRGLLQHGHAPVLAVDGSDVRVPGLQLGDTLACSLGLVQVGSLLCVILFPTSCLLLGYILEVGTVLPRSRVTEPGAPRGPLLLVFSGHFTSDFCHYF